jgi:hypothetical protein
MRPAQFSFILTLMYGILLVLFCSCGSRMEYLVEINAGELDRVNSIISFDVPLEFVPGMYYLTDENGSQQIIQVDDRQMGWTIIDSMKAGERRKFRLSPKTIGISESDTFIEATTDSATISFRINNSSVLTYFYRESEIPEGVETVFRRAGYMHPVRTPAGFTVTHDFPEDHFHHYGIWSAWTRVEFDGREPDFWNVGGATGRVEAESLAQIWEGAVQSGFQAHHRFIDLTGSEPVTALREQWNVRVYNVSQNYHVFDLEVVQTTATNNPIRLPEYRYGGIGFRGPDDWNGEDKAYFLTSEGRERINGHATRARWCHIGGYINGHLAGIAIMDHPDNFRHPQSMRIHPNYPFFNYAPVQLGDMSIEPGAPYKTLYRYIVYDGEPDVEELERIWNDFAAPPSGIVLSE